MRESLEQRALRIQGEMLGSPMWQAWTTDEWFIEYARRLLSEQQDAPCNQRRRDKMTLDAKVVLEIAHRKVLNTAINDEWFLDFAAAIESRCREAWKDWLPTTESVNALPTPLRKYIADLETRCDPAGDIAALTFAKDQVRQLEASNRQWRDKWEKEQAAAPTLGKFSQQEVNERAEALRKRKKKDE